MTQPQPHKRSGIPRFLVYCLLFSFIFHLLLIWLLPKYIPEHESLPPEPTYVSLEELPLSPEKEPVPQERELDQTPEPDQDPPEEATRLAEANQKVEEEMAPRGEDSRDQPSVPASPEVVEESPAPEVPPAPETPSEAESTPEVIAEQKPQDTGLQASKPEQKEQAEQKEISEKKPPPLDLGLSPETFKRMARNEQRKRVKRRDEVLEGDAVYLNLQHDFLISFFKRFSNRIESVWNYPDNAAQRGEQGTLLLKITITREGKLLDVELLETSGYDSLDYEAIQAIYRAAPFGPVTKHWPHDEMKIYSHFQYTLSNRYIYGR